MQYKPVQICLWMLNRDKFDSKVNQPKPCHKMLTDNYNLID